MTEWCLGSGSFRIGKARACLWNKGREVLDGICHREWFTQSLWILGPGFAAPLPCSLPPAKWTPDRMWQSWDLKPYLSGCKEGPVWGDGESTD